MADSGQDRIDKTPREDRLPRAYMVDVLRAWQAWKGEGDAPHLSRLDPAAFPKALPYLALIRIEHPAGRALVSLVGEGAVEAVGVNFTGHYMDEIPGSEIGQARIAAIVENREPFLDLDDPMAFSPLDYKTISVLSLPFLDDEDRVAAVLLVQSFSL